VTAENEVYKVTPDDPDMLKNIARPFKKSDICLQELTATDSLLNLLESGAGKFNILLVLGYLSHSLLDNCMQLGVRKFTAFIHRNRCIFYISFFDIIKYCNVLFSL
jgi:hypothetical protein